MSTSARKHAAAAVLLLLALITSLVLLAKPSGVAAADTTPSGVSEVSGTAAIACSDPQTGIAQVTLTNAQPGTPLVARVVALVDGTMEGTPVLASFTASDGTALNPVTVQLPDTLGITSKIQITDITDAAPAQVIDVPTAPDGNDPMQTDLACDPSVQLAPTLTSTTSAPVCSTDLSTQSDATVDVQLATDQSAFTTATSVVGAVNVARESTNELGQTIAPFSLTAAVPTQSLSLLFLSNAPANYLVQAVMSDGVVQVVSGSSFASGACPVVAPTTPTPTITPTDSATDTASPPSSTSARPSASASDSSSPVDSASPSDTGVVSVPPVSEPPIIPGSSPAASSSIALPAGTSSAASTATRSATASAEATAPFQGPVASTTTGASSAAGVPNGASSPPAGRRGAPVVGPVDPVVATSHVQLPLLADQPSTSKPAVRLLAWHQDAALIVGIDAVAVSALVGATVWSARRR